MSISDDIRSLYGDGMKAGAIASKLNVHRNLVYRVICRLNKGFGPDGGPRPVTLLLSPEARLALTMAAIGRGISIRELAMRLLETIGAEPALIGNVLDDGSES